MKTAQKTVYIAEDLTEFTSDAECIKYEQKLAKKQLLLEKLKVHTVVWCFEATEGRGYYNTTHIITDFDVNDPEILNYCYITYGKPLKPWYGESTYAEWKLYENKTIQNMATFLKQIIDDNGKKTNKYLSGGKTNTVFISKSDAPTEELLKIQVSYLAKNGISDRS